MIILLLKFGDFINASKQVQHALSLNKDNPDLWCLKGQIEIETSRIELATDSFRKAISLDKLNPHYLLWNAYSRYLSVEFSSESSNDFDKKIHDTNGKNENIGKSANVKEYGYKKINKRQQEKLLSIIRDLERLLMPLGESNGYDKQSKKCGDVNINAELCLKNLKVSAFDYKKKNENNYENNWKEIQAYTSYFTGCFYYKIGDFFAAKEKLEECKKLKSKISLEKSADLLVGNVWKYQIKPTWWEWWLGSPCACGRKRLLFVGIILFIFLMFLPAIQDILGNIIQLIGSFISVGPLAHLNESSTTINWEENSILYSAFILTLLLLLLTPNIERIAAKEISIEMQRSPPPFEFFPSTIPLSKSEKYPATRELKMEDGLPSHLKDELEEFLKGADL
ncbi:tetratricopeptide repeat protein [Methanosarcina sp. Mfa9]|uniref:tetratricopeptide repeat protein n=1 Tax=Methanosarcina sp. Mfa9 TaxID=3439063 RepID=UPI003F847AE1